MMGPCCCCPAIGVPYEYWGPWITECCPQGVIVTYVHDQITLVDDIDLLFLGYVPSRCGYAAVSGLPETSDWQYVSDWIQAGGRVCLVGEYGGPMEDNLHCFTEEHQTEFNDFLSYIGSTMTAERIVCCPFCGNPCEVNSDAPIMTDIDTLYYAATGYLNIGNGTWIAKTAGTDPSCSAPDYGSGCTSGLIYCGIEQLGEGYICLLMDSSVTFSIGTWGCGDNCEFFRRLGTWGTLI